MRVRAVLSLLVFAACAGAAPPPLPLAGAYEGVLPCADCEGIRWELSLRDDDAFFLRRAYLGRSPGTFDDIGKWGRSADGKTIELRGGQEAPIRFAIREGGLLRLLDLHGNEIESNLNYDLARRAGGAPLEPSLAMRGMFSYMADAGVFRECITGLRLPVAHEGDNAMLESEYLEAQRHAGEPLLVNVEGRIAMRESMESSQGEIETLVVDRFVGVWPGETCGAPLATAELTNTYWRLVRIGGRPVQVAPDRREPHFRLIPGSNEVKGSGGCNTFFGGWELEDTKLTFGPLGATRMYCADGMEQETEFLRALDAMADWKITGDHLDFFDAEGTHLARFEATYLK